LQSDVLEGEKEIPRLNDFIFIFYIMNYNTY